MKRWPALVLLSLILALPAGAQLRLEYRQFILPNGLNVILHEDHSLPTVAVNLWYHVGSSREKPGRTGFAHLFEHLMFDGSANVPYGKFDQWLEAAGADNNASTTADRTNYYENGPSNALDLMLFLESDRAAYLLKTMTPATVDQQRDVVKNERRQSYENRPYGMAQLTIGEHVYPTGHPYHWPTIGSMEDLTAASYDDVVDFFKKYYVPNNASLVIGGDIDPVATEAKVRKWFAEVPRGNPVPPQDIPGVELTSEQHVTIEDEVQLPRLYMVWLSPPLLTPGDAELDLLSSILTGGKNSRLYKRLVYDMQIAQDVSAFQASAKLSSSFQVIVTARAGHTLTEIAAVVQEEIEKMKHEPPSEHEFRRAVNQYEVSFLDRLESLGSIVDQLNGYFAATGDPDYFNEDMSRYRALAPDDVRSAAQTYLPDNARFILSVVPKGKRELGLPEAGGK